VDVAPLIHLLKGEVKQAASLLNVPKLIIDRPPSAGL
jgi:NAD+ synthase